MLIIHEFFEEGVRHRTVLSFFRSDAFFLVEFALRTLKEFVAVTSLDEVFSD